MKNGRLFAVDKDVSKRLSNIKTGEVMFFVDRFYAEKNGLAEYLDMSVRYPGDTKFTKINAVLERI